MMSPKGSEPRQRTLSANASRAKLKRSLTLPYTNSTTPHAGSSSSYLMPWSKRVVLSPTSDSTRSWLILNHQRIDHFVTRAGRRRPGWLACLLIVGMGLSCFLLGKLLTRLDKPTLVFRREHLQLIWRYASFSSPTLSWTSWIVETTELGGRSRADITQAKFRVCHSNAVLCMKPRADCNSQCPQR